MKKERVQTSEENPPSKQGRWHRAILPAMLALLILALFVLPHFVLQSRFNTVMNSPDKRVELFISVEREPSQTRVMFQTQSNLSYIVCGKEYGKYSNPFLPMNLSTPIEGTGRNCVYLDKKEGYDRRMYRIQPVILAQKPR